MATKQILLSYHLVDELNVEAVVNIYATVADTATVAQIDTDYTTLGTAIDLITGAYISKGKWSLIMPNQGVKTGATSGSRVEQTGVFDFRNASTTKLQGIALPALLNSLLTGGRINESATAVSGFSALLSTGTTLVTIVPTNAAFQTLTTRADSFISFRKRRKQLFRSSVEL